MFYLTSKFSEYLFTLVTFKKNMKGLRNLPVTANNFLIKVAPDMKPFGPNRGETPFVGGPY